MQYITLLSFPLLAFGLWPLGVDLRANVFLLLPGGCFGHWPLVLCVEHVVLEPLGRPVISNLQSDHSCMSKLLHHPRSPDGKSHRGYESGLGALPL